MSALKFVEYKAAKEAYNAAYDTNDNASLTKRLESISFYHHCLDKLVMRMLDQEGMTEPYRTVDRDVTGGRSYYQLNCPRSRRKLYALACQLGLSDFPSFASERTIHIDVDMPPNDVVAEVRQMAYKVEKDLQKSIKIMEAYASVIK